MIAANKNDLLDALLYLYFRRMARNSFHTIAGRGIEHLRRLPKDRPAIIFCNHTNWWDALFVYLLTRQMSHKACYCMMEEKQLKVYKFFSWLGAFSVDLTSPLRSAVSLRYAQRLLQKPETVVYIFPQGKICRQNQPMEARPGTDFLARNAPHAMLVPMAMRYDFFREDRPNALFEVGQPFQAKDLTDGRIAAECNQLFARLSEASANQDLTGFSPIYPPRWSNNKRWEWIKRAVTGRLRDFKPTN